MDCTPARENFSSHVRGFECPPRPPVALVFNVHLKMIDCESMMAEEGEAMLHAWFGRVGEKVGALSMTIPTTHRLGTRNSMPTYAKTGPLTLRILLDDYPVSMALKDGRVTSDLVKLEFVGPKPAINGFKSMVREQAYDAGELAIVTYLQAKDFSKPYVMLPVPMVGRFQHHCIGFNKEFGQIAPKDLEGRKVGVRTYAQTTGLWVRGILQHEYGVELDKVSWMTTDESHLAEYRDPPNCQRLPKGSSLADMMLNGELAAVIMGSDMPKDERIERLIPDPNNAAKVWYAREHVVPINHMFVVHEDLLAQRPDVVRELGRMLIESRSMAPPETFETFPPIGLEANRKGIALAIQWAHDQKIIQHAFAVDELFNDVTAQMGA